MPERISISEWVFVIRNNSGVQIFNSVLDKKARQKTFTKNVGPYTLVVVGSQPVVIMNWNPISYIFRIRFRIFYHIFELSHCSCNSSQGHVFLFHDILLVCFEGGQFLYTGRRKSEIDGFENKSEIPLKYSFNVATLAFTIPRVY